MHSFLLLIMAAPQPTESQAHGFIWERDILQNVFQAPPQQSYTSIFDLPAEHNPLVDGENISIKAFGANTIDLGDAMRIFNYEQVPSVTLIAIRYTQLTPQTKRIRDIYELRMGGPDAHAILFGRVTRDDISQLVQMLRAIPPGAGNEALRQAVHAKKEELNNKSGVIRFNPKMDSGSQRRLQCSIPNLSGIVEQHPSLLISHTNAAAVRGQPITATIHSAPRQRRPRQQPLTVG
jgi:hypothetical protein